MEVCINHSNDRNVPPPPQSFQAKAPLPLFIIRSLDTRPQGKVLTGKVLTPPAYPKSSRSPSMAEVVEASGSLLAAEDTTIAARIIAWKDFMIG